VRLLWSLITTTHDTLIGKNPGHTVAECPNPVVCNKCFQKGHTAAKCPSTAKVCFLCQQSGHTVSTALFGRLIFLTKTSFMYSHETAQPSQKPEADYFSAWYLMMLLLDPVHTLMLSVLLSSYIIQNFGHFFTIPTTLMKSPNFVGARSCTSGV
jgi:hypothetical protein